MKASTTVRRRLPTATPAFDTHKQMQKHNHQRFLIFSSDSSSSFCQHVSLTSGFSLLSSSCASSSSSSMVSISRRRRRVNLVSAVVLLSCCLVLASTALSSVSAAGTFGSVCSLGSVGSFGSAVGNQLLTLTLGPAVRISQYRQIILDSWANNWSQATLQQINQFLVPVTSTSASNPNGTFGQIFYNFSQPASFPASGVAVVDLNPNRFTSFYFGRYAYNGAKHWSISCIVGLLLQNAIPLSGFNAPAMFACLQPTNQAAMCAQYPRRCDAFQQSLPLALQTAELAWRWALPLESLLPQFASEYPQATVLYQDDLGSIRTGNAQVMTYDCTLAFPANASLCSQYSLVSYYGSDSAATPAIGLSYGFAFREANAATGIPFANFTWFDPPTMNARPADIYSAYIGGEIIVVNQLSIQDPTIGVSAELAITEISTTGAYQVKLQQVLINLLGVDINQPSSAPFFYFLTDSVGKIDIAPGAAASAFMCSKYSAAARIAAGVNGSTTTGSGCNNAAQHVQYLTNTFTHIWTVNASEFAPIRSLLSIFRLATPQEYANYSGSLNNIMEGQIAQPFVSTVQNVMLDDQSYALSISGYAVRSYLSWWVVVGVPLAGYLNLQAQWSLIIPDFVATQYVDNVQQTTASAVASSSANSEISVNIQTLYFRPDDLQLPQGGGQWFIVYLNNTGLLPVSFSFSISLPNSFATNGGLTVSPRTATIPSGQTLTINLTLTGNTLMSLLGTTTPFTLVPSPSGAGLCLQPITSAITVSWRWTNQINYVGTPLMATVWVFAFLALFLVIYFIQRTIRMREDPSIKAGTWFASVIIQFHLVFLVAASMLFSLDPSSDSICQARAWMLAVGGVGVMIPLATRMWRIRRIFVQEKLKIARISHLQVFVLIVLLELLLLPVFAATIYVGSSGSALSSTLVTSSQYTDNTKFIYGQVYQCQNYETTLAAGGAIVGGLTIICSIFAWQTRSVPGAFNDAIKVVLFDLFVLAFCGIIIPLQLLLTDQVLVSALRSAGGIVVACILVLLLFTSALDHFLVVHSPDSVTFFKNESGMGNTNTQIRVKVQGKQSIVSAGQASAITGVPGTVHRGSNPSIGNAKKSNGLAPGFHTMSPPSKYTLPEVQVSGMDTNYTFTNGSSTGNGVTLIGGSGGGVGTMSGSYEVVQVAARISPQPKLAFANTTKEPSSSGGWMPKE